VVPGILNKDKKKMIFLEFSTAIKTNLTPIWGK